MELFYYFKSAIRGQGAISCSLQREKKRKERKKN